MAEIMTSLSDMPWLMRGGDPVGSLAAGAQVGSQIAGRRQEQQRINLAQQQLARQMAMDEINRTTMLQEQQMNAVKLESYLRGRQALTRLTNDIGSALVDGGPVQAMKIHAKAGSQNPDLFLAPEYNEMGDRLAKVAQQDAMQTWRVAQAELAEARAKAESLKAENDKLRLDQAERRIGLGEKIEDRKERELTLRLEQQASKLDPRQRQLMQEKMAAIRSDTWMDLDTKIKRLEDVGREFGMPTVMPPAPGNLQTPAPAAGSTSAPDLQPATKRFKWTPGGLQPK